jgi:hypothetical protein
MTTDSSSPAPVELSAEASAPKKEQVPSPFTAAAKVIRAVQLEAVRFSAFASESLAFRADEAVVFNGSSSFLRPEVRPREQGISTKLTLTFRLNGRFPDESETTCALIRATLHADYRFKPESPVFSADETRDFALCYAAFHVWGYWREFVQSSLARLELPHVTIPLYLIDQAPKMVRDTQE